MFSTVRANEFGSITKSKKEMGVLAGDAKMALLKQTNKQTCKQVVYTELKDVNTNLREPVHLPKAKGMFVNLVTMLNSQLPATYVL